MSRWQVWEKVKPCTFGAKGEEKVHLLRRRNAGRRSCHGKGVWEKAGAGATTETGRGGGDKPSPRSPRKAEVGFKDERGDYVIIS